MPVHRVDDPDLRRVIADKLTRLPRGPKKVICTYDQSCNLSCPSCRTEPIVERQHRGEILAIQDKLRSQALPDAEYLHITGSGDPFGSPYFRRWLQTMSRTEVPRLERLHLHTNGLLWTPRMWNTIPEEIRAVIKSAEISIDAATPGTYAINRRGGRFETLLENLEFIRTLRRHGPLDYAKISMVVQENNFQEMPGFVRLGQRLGFDAVYFGQLVNWGTFSDEEFRRRAVHLPGHPRHHEFVRLLQDPVFEGPIVDLGNLTAARRSGGRRTPRLTRLWRRMTTATHR
jgi:MoaA/NifB/PqqE/SkfB family radical SAM enzyme